MADDLDFAIRETIRLGAGASTWRRKQFRLMKKLCNTALGVDACFPLGQAATRMGCKVPAGSVDLLRYALQWPDVRLACLFTQGAQVVGDLDKAGI